MIKRMYPGVNNSVETATAAPVSAQDTVIELVSAAVLPPAPNLVTLGTDEDAEVVRYNGVNGNALTGCERGFSGTLSRVWEAGAAAYRAFTLHDYDALMDNITALDAGKADAVHTHALADVTGLADDLAAKDTAIANQSAALDAHAADAGLHVTAAKQAAWDAKAEAGDVTAMQTSLAAHQSTAAHSEAGAHGLRYHAGELQYGGTGAWTTIETGSEVAEPGITDTPRLVNLSRRSAVLAAANWAGEAQPYTYELPVPGSRADGSNDVDIWFAPGAGNDEQAGAWSAARITGGAQGDDTVTLIAVGDKPGVDMPVIIRLVG